MSYVFIDKVLSINTPTEIKRMSLAPPGHQRTRGGVGSRSRRAHNSEAERLNVGMGQPGCCSILQIATIKEWSIAKPTGTTGRGS